MTTNKQAEKKKEFSLDELQEKYEQAQRELLSKDKEIKSNQRALEEAHSKLEKKDEEIKIQKAAVQAATLKGPEAVIASYKDYRPTDNFSYYHVLVDRPYYDPKNGRKVSREIVQFYGKKAFQVITTNEETGNALYQQLGYTVFHVLYDPTTGKEGK